MGNDKGYIFSQTRLQARHGARPEEQDWLFVEAHSELAGYLNTARQTRLRPWVISLHANENHHVLEATLAQEYRLYIHDVSMWLPGPWQQAVQWTKWLVDLPSLQYLLTGNTAPAWMLEQPQLKSFVSGDTERRLQAMQETDCAVLVDGWMSGKSLIDAWTKRWQQLWGEVDEKQKRPMILLVETLKQEIDFASINAEVFSKRETHTSPGILPDGNQKFYIRLINVLTKMFRRYRYQPVTVFIHLALVALDVERLRGGIVQRKLFPGYERTSEDGYSGESIPGVLV